MSIYLFILTYINAAVVINDPYEGDRSKVNKFYLLYILEKNDINK